MKLVKRWLNLLLFSLRLSNLGWQLREFHTKWVRVSKSVGELGQILLGIEILFSQFGSYRHIKVGEVTPVSVSELTDDINLPYGLSSVWDGI